MRRYHESDVPGELLGEPVQNYLLLGTVGYALLLGIGMVIVGRVIKQLWITFWGAGLVVASASYFLLEWWWIR